MSVYEVDTGFEGIKNWRSTVTGRDYPTRADAEAAEANLASQTPQQAARNVEVPVWTRRYYERYVRDAQSAGVAPVDIATFAQEIDTSNYEGSYSNPVTKYIKTPKADEYNALAREYADLTGTAVSSKAPQDIDIGNINTQIADMRANIARAKKTKTDEETAKTEAQRKAEELAKPSAELLAIQARIQGILDNPETVNPESVKKWTEYLNTINAEEDKKAAQRLTQQFAALGDIGSSAQRRAMTELTATTQLGRESAALGLAQEELGQKTSQVSDALTRLLTIEGIKTQNATIPLQMQWSDYVTKQQQGFQSAQNIANQLFQTRQKEMDIAAQERANQALMALYRATQPKAQEWWQPLVNVGLTAAGIALGGGVGSLLGLGTQKEAAKILTSTPSLVKG